MLIFGKKKETCKEYILGRRMHPLAVYRILDLDLKSCMIVFELVFVILQNEVTRYSKNQLPLSINEIVRNQ